METQTVPAPADENEVPISGLPRFDDPDLERIIRNNFALALQMAAQWAERYPLG